MLAQKSLRPFSHTICIPFFAALALSAVALFGCSGEVVLTDGGPSGGQGDSDGGGGSCSTGGTVQPDPAPLVVTGVQTGALIGNTLHIEATVDGVARYLVIRIDEDGVARAVAMPDDLLGPANLSEVMSRVYVRVMTGDAGAPVLDLIDMENPEMPVRMSAFELSGSVASPAVFSAKDGHAYFCMTPEGETKPQLHSMDLTDPLPPGPVPITTTYACDPFLDKHFLTAGATWISWDTPTGSYVQSTHLYTLTPDKAVHLVDYGYNQTGVHMYGNVLSAATSGQRAAWDPENKALFLLASAEGDPTDANNPPFSWATLSAGTTRQLLGVADTKLYLHTDSGVRQYDITDITDPKLTDFEATIEPFEGALRTLATSDRFLAVVDGAGTLFLLPRKEGGAVGPLVVHAADYVPAEPEGCAD